MFNKCETEEGILPGQMNLIFRARMLWRDVGTWLVMYMISLYGGSPNLQSIANKLYKVPLDYGNMMKVFFGDKISEDYINLLSNHIITLENLFYAQMTNNQDAVNAYAKQIYQNIDQRSTFLASINPYWQYNTWQTLLYTFNNMLLEYSTALLTKDFERSTDIFDRLLTQSTIIGDYFSEGIINYLEVMRTSRSSFSDNHKF